jgi:hypothetical protein
VQHNYSLYLTIPFSSYQTLNNTFIYMEIILFRSGVFACHSNPAAAPTRHNLAT